MSFNNPFVQSVMFSTRTTICIFRNRFCETISFHLMVSIFRKNSFPRVQPQVTNWMVTNVISRRSSRLVSRYFSSNFGFWHSEVANGALSLHPPSTRHVSHDAFFYTALVTSTVFIAFVRVVFAKPQQLLNPATPRFCWNAVQLNNYCEPSLVSGSHSMELC